MRGRELSRTDKGNGYTEIMVALGNDRQGLIVVPTSLVDAEGYQDMLDAHAAKHAGLVTLREGGAIA